MSALDRQVGGNHYKNMSIQPWHALRVWLGDEGFRAYLLGTAIAYLARANTTGVEGKGGDTDVGKAIHTLEAMLEVPQRVSAAQAETEDTLRDALERRGMGFRAWRADPVTGEFEPFEGELPEDARGIVESILRGLE